MGFILLGILSFSSIGMVGGSYQQVSHAITSTALFALVAFLIERRGSANLKDFGGLKSKVPLLAALFLISMLASVGLPGLNGFVGEFMTIIGSFQSAYVGRFGYGVPVLAGLGVVLSAVYLLYLFQQVFYGKSDDRPLPDLGPREALLVGSLVLLMVWGGLYPLTFTGPTEQSLAMTASMATAQPGQGPVWRMNQLSEPEGEGGLESRR
jgi:NADH-quinone oxidoreductase subunit M